MESLNTCGRSVAVGARFGQCCCPAEDCRSKNIYLVPILTAVDFEMNCRDCGHIWDADKEGECVCNGDLVKEMQEIMMRERK